jgi:hypothetical protein
MSTTLFSDLEPLIEPMVDSEVVPLFEDDTAFYNDFMMGDEEFVTGRGFKLKAYASPNESLNAFSEAGPYAVPGKEEYFEMMVYPTRTSKGVEWSGDVVDAWKTTTQALDDMSGKLQPTTKWYKKQMQRLMFGDGTGNLGVIATGGVAGAVITFGTTYVEGWTKGATFLTERQRVNWFTAAGVQRSGGAITLSTVVSNTQTTVTFDQVPTDLAATDYCVPENSHNKFFFGLKALITNANTMLQGVLRSSRPQLKSQEINAGGALLTPMLLDKTKSAHEFLASPDAKNIRIVSTIGQKFQYKRGGYNMMQIGQGGKYTGDMRDVGHLDSEWLTVNDCDEDRVYLYEKSVIKKYQLRKFGFYDYGDNKFFRKGSGGSNSDAITGWLGWKGNFGIKNPQAASVIKNLSITDAPTAVTSRQY